LDLRLGWGRGRRGEGNGGEENTKGRGKDGSYGSSVYYKVYACFAQRSYSVFRCYLAMKYSL